MRGAGAGGAGAAGGAGLRPGGAGHGGPGAGLGGGVPGGRLRLAPRGGVLWAAASGADASGTCHARSGALPKLTGT